MYITALQCIAAVVAIYSAALWWRAAAARIYLAQVPLAMLSTLWRGYMAQAAIEFRDVASTESAMLNAQAAAYTGLAAALQAVVILLQAISNFR